MPARSRPPAPHPPRVCARRARPARSASRRRPRAGYEPFGGGRDGAPAAHRLGERAVGRDEQPPVLLQPRQKPPAASPTGIDSVPGRQRRRVLLQALDAIQLVTNRLLVASFGRTRQTPQESRQGHRHYSSCFNQEDLSEKCTTAYTHGAPNLVKEAEERDLTLLLLYTSTGLRREEVISPRVQDVTVEDDRIILSGRVKGGRYRAREIRDPEVRAALGRRTQFRVGCAVPPPGARLRETAGDGSRLAFPSLRNPDAQASGGSVGSKFITRSRRDQTAVEDISVRRESDNVPRSRVIRIFGAFALARFRLGRWTPQRYSPTPRPSA